MNVIGTTLRDRKQAHAWLKRVLTESVYPILDSGATLMCEFFDGKSREQERLYHSVFRDVARDCTFMGGKADEETWKRLLVDAFYRATKDDPELKGDWENRAPRIVPNLDGTGFVSVEIQTRRFTKVLATNFITYLHAWGDEQGVKWSRTSLGRDWSGVLQ